MTSCIGLFQQKQLSLVKSIKQQILYFSYFHPSIRTLCKNLRNHMLYIFTPFIFSRNYQLFKIKQEDHIPCMLTIGLVFFQLEHVNTRSAKLESHFYHFPSSSYAFYKIENNLKALIQLNLILLEKHLKQQVSYFYQIVHFMMNPIKFASHNLDIPSSRYEFLKHVFKSVKTNKKIKESLRLKDGARLSAKPKQRTEVDR